MRLRGASRRALLYFREISVKYGRSGARARYRSRIALKYSGALLNPKPLNRKRGARLGEVRGAEEGRARGERPRARAAARSPGPASRRTCLTAGASVVVG